MKNKVLVLCLIADLYFSGYAFGQEEPGIEDRLIASTFKTMAKAFVLVTDINKLKENNINILIKMDDEKFQRRYAKAYEILKDLPYSLRSRYKVTEHMTKEQAIKDIRSLNKNRIYEIIDLAPDKIVAYQFRQRLRNRKQNVQKENLADQINNFWNELLRKSGFSTPQPIQH